MSAIIEDEYLTMLETGPLRRSGQIFSHSFVEKYLLLEARALPIVIDKFSCQRGARKPTPK